MIQLVFTFGPLPAEKTCTRCGETKLADGFYKNAHTDPAGRRRYYLMSWCKTCHSGWSAERYRQRRALTIPQTSPPTAATAAGHQTG